MGCAVENLCIAASHIGYKTQLAECSTKGIILELTKSDFIIEDILFHQIEKRQTNRSIYNGNRISNGALKQLQSIQKKGTIQLYFIEIGRPLADTITDYIMKGNEIQMNDVTFKNELLSWMRFNNRQVESTHDGLSLSIDKAISMLNALELYAVECYNNTAMFYNWSISV